MSPLMIALVLFVLMLAMMAARVPIAVAMFIAGALGYLWMAGPSPLLNHLKTYAYARFSSYDLSVIPLFLLMGQFATQGGLSKALFKFAAALLGGYRGGLAMAAVGVWPVAAIFFVVFGGIYGGVFTPTEGASIGAASTFLTAVVRRELSIEKFKLSFYATAQASAMIFMIFLGADMLNSALALTQAPNQLAATVGALGWPPLAIIGAILVFYVLLGCVMDELSMILLTIPIFFPLILALDFGLKPDETAIWFGILVLMVVEIGLIAPPVGLNVYVVNGMDKRTPIAESYRGVVPFLITDFIRTTLLLLFPAITLYLVRLMN